MADGKQEKTKERGIPVDLSKNIISVEIDGNIISVEIDRHVVKAYKLGYVNGVSACLATIQKFTDEGMQPADVIEAVARAHRDENP